jgi:hypothetical protein
MVRKLKYGFMKFSEQGQPYKQEETGLIKQLNGKQSQINLNSI